MNKTFTAAADDSELAPSELPTENTFVAKDPTRVSNDNNYTASSTEKPVTKTSQEKPRESPRKSPRDSKQDRPLPPLEPSQATEECTQPRQQTAERQSSVMGEGDDDCISEHLTESMIQMPQIEMPPQKPASQVQCDLFHYYIYVISKKIFNKSN